MKSISIIVPCYNEEDFIEACIHSVLASRYPKELMEVFIIDGGSNDNSINIVKRLMQENKCIRLINNPFKAVPFAMNIGIKEAKGEFIIRLDAHSSYPGDYFLKLIEYAQKLDSDNIGGICVTDVKIKNRKTLAIKEVLSNKFGVGNSLFRVGVDRITEVDTVVFGCFKRDVFTRFGYYDERLIRNQDIELNKRIKRGGGRLFLVPEIKCTYYARDTFKGIITNNYQNGKWNILTVYYTKAFDSLSLRHFIPAIFILSLILPLVLSVFYLPFGSFSVFTLIVYIILLLIISISLSIKKKLNLFCLLSAFLVLHFSYGIGSMVGLVKLPFLKDT